VSHDLKDGLDERYRRVLRSGQSLASILLDYEICPHCQHVHRIRARAARSCPVCKADIGSGRIYAPLMVYSLINLIQDLYRMELSRISVTGERIVERKGARHYVGILLLFCTLVECWMACFLRSLMVSHHLPKADIDRLLSDNWRLEDRKGRLFKTQTGEAFGNAIKDLTRRNKEAGGDLNYEGVWSSIENAIKSRNKVIHNGAIRAFPEHLIGECVRNIDGVNQLFISLHNRYIAQASTSREA